MTEYLDNDFQRQVVEIVRRATDQTDPAVKEEQEDSEPSDIKEEQEEEEISTYPFNIVVVKSEEDAGEAPPFQLHQTTSSTQCLKADNSGGPEPSSDSLLGLHSDHQRSLSAESDTDDSEDWRETSDSQSAPNSTRDMRVDEQSLSCSGCGKVCSSKRGLTKHKLACPGESLACSVCGKRFTLRGSLKRHMRIHTGEKPFSCSQCGKSFNQRETLKTHMRIHTGEKPYRCCLCCKSFNQREYLKTHIRIHTGEKPFSCTQCGKCFNQRENLKTHLRIHTGEKPFSCSQCGRRFKRRDYLKSHMKIHTREKTLAAQDEGNVLSLPSLNLSKVIT
ncbi:oocyte zinc finger protein XlCOF20-like [Synchiropus splendidus]|uniref:oocyte zinc finger protein XlCOF20-like n=1 Tax=Synchiropus splendidus TaxID=270530 RepID=UPI00237EC9AA|nr:oocyte zinc finger protein XlCOF20-like [Synchiropus splendidus]